jgi:hypothetical protein
MLEYYSFYFIISYLKILLILFLLINIFIYIFFIIKIFVKDNIEDESKDNIEDESNDKNKKKEFSDNDIEYYKILNSYNDENDKALKNFKISLNNLRKAFSDY